MININYIVRLYGVDDVYNYEPFHGLMCKLYGRKHCSMNVSTHRAIQFGHLEILKWLFKNGHRDCTSNIKMAAQYGCLGTIKWLELNSSKAIRDQWVTLLAAKGGFVHILKYLAVYKY